MTTRTFTLTMPPTSDEIVRAWHRGWCYHDEMNHDRKQAIAKCPYPAGRLRREWIGGWDYADNLERQDTTVLAYEETEADRFWGEAEMAVGTCGVD